MAGGLFASAASLQGGRTDKGEPMTIPLRCRQASVGDARAIASVFTASFRLLAFLPTLHTAEEDQRFIENDILKECEVTVAESEGRIISFLARDGGEIRLLYTHPNFIGLGAGGRLIEAAQRCGVAALELWCFQANVRARKFYEARGFRAVRFTDGDSNEEKMPDVRYRWERSRRPPERS
jgi:GNAT superfamily N-acetyltransferase